MSAGEKVELYKIIMRERNENAELEKLRIEQNENYKELQKKYKTLEKFKIKNWSGKFKKRKRKTTN